MSVNLNNEMRENLDLFIDEAHARRREEYSNVLISEGLQNVAHKLVLDALPLPCRDTHSRFIEYDHISFLTLV